MNCLARCKPHHGVQSQKRNRDKIVIKPTYFVTQTLLMIPFFFPESIS